MPRCFSISIQSDLAWPGATALDGTGALDGLSETAGPFR